MQLLMKKSILSCTEEEQILHEEEFQEIMNRIRKLPDFECAVICRPLDIQRADQKPWIRTCRLHFIDYIRDWDDTSKGMDMWLDDDSYPVLICYGSEYSYENEMIRKALSCKILPFNEDHVYMNIANALFYDGDIIPADNQFSAGADPQKEQ